MVLTLTVMGQEGREEAEPNLIGSVDLGDNEVHRVLILIHPVGEREPIYEITMEISGEFSLHLRPGNYSYLAEAEGFHPARGEFWIAANEITTISIVMERIEEETDHNLVGKVVDMERNPVPRAVVMVYGPEGPLSRALTGERGAFSFRLRPGAYTLTVEAPGFLGHKQRFRIGNETLELVVPLEKKEVVRVKVKGCVMAPEGEQIGGARVTFFGMGPLDDVRPEEAVRGPEPITVRTGPEGWFDLVLQAGAYEVHAEAEGFLEYHDLIRIGKQDVFEMRIVLEHFHEEPIKELRMRFNYTDRNSDGTPEKIEVFIDADMDPDWDVVVTYIDRDGDGNPETVETECNLDMEALHRIMELLSELRMLGPQDKWDGEIHIDDDGIPYPPEWDKERPPDPSEGWDGTKDRPIEDGKLPDQNAEGKEKDVIIDEDGSELPDEGPDEAGSEADGAPLEGGATGGDGSSKDKSSGSGLEIAAAVSVAAVVALLVAGVAMAVRLGKRRA